MSMTFGTKPASKIRAVSTDVLKGERESSTRAFANILGWNAKATERLKTFRGHVRSIPSDNSQTILARQSKDYNTLAP
jgi:hypothetical protein